MGLTKREKFLIFFAAVVAVTFVAVQFVLMPMYNRRIELLEERSFLQMEKVRIESKIMTEDIIIQSYERAVDEFEVMKGMYPINISNDVITNIFTEICRESGFSTLSFDVSPQRRPVAEGITVFSTAGVTMSLSGGLDDVGNLISALEEIDYIRLSRLSFSDNQPQGGMFEIGSGAASSNISATFEMIILNEPESD